MRPELDGLHDQHFDVIIFGGGINGASSAYQLTAAGYKTLLVEKADFGSGASSRSSRLLHCGLMYLAPYDSFGAMLLHPGHVIEGIQMARYAMRGRDNFTRHLAHRFDPFPFYFPLSTDQPYSPSQVKTGLKILQALYRKGPPLKYDHLDLPAAQKIPFLKLVSNQERLLGAIRLEEYKYNWPERIVMDYVLGAEAAGATVRNYTAVEKLERAESGRWKVSLRDTTPNTNAGVAVSADLILNLTGVWTDTVNRLGDSKPSPKVGMTKGVHIAVKLAPEFHGSGFVAMQKDGKGPFFCVPWYDTHYIGPTRTRFDEDIDDVRPTEQDIQTLLDDTANLLPGLRLTRSQVLYAWAGVRPQTFDPTHPLGAAHARKLHDLAAEGMPNVFAITSSPIMYERQTGEEMLALARKKVSPSRERKNGLPPLAARQNERDILMDVDKNVASLRDIATQEHCVSLIDLLCRRLGACWQEGQGLGIAPRVAEIVAPVMGWDSGVVKREAGDYRTYMERFFLGPFAQA